jgi:ATP-dependent RNA helicase RhlB
LIFRKIKEKWARRRKKTVPSKEKEIFPVKKAEPDESPDSGTAVSKKPLPDRAKRAKRPPSRKKPVKKDDAKGSIKPGSPDKRVLEGQKEAGTGKAWNLSEFEVPPLEGRTRFHDLGIPDPVMHAIADLGFQYCTPIQAEILPSTLEGKDATGRAQTGTGKTAAFLITFLTRMLNDPLNGKRANGTPRCLVIAPTRELVMQIAEEAHGLSGYCPFKIVSVFGGMDYEKQRRQLTGARTDIVVATPGRLLDFNRKRDIHLDKVEMLVLDEADRMLDMGFIPDVRQIIRSTPPKNRRQTMLFSATLTPEVTRLASQWTREPVVVEIEPEQVAVDTVDQLVYLVTDREKYALLYNVITRQNLERVLVFCNRRDETRRLAEMLGRYRINCDLLSGEVPQKKRVRTLEEFKSGKIRVLVATDVAGRGIHVEGISHVINYTMPHDPEDYVHRIGRTGRAGASGISVSFATERDSFYIPAIQEFTGRDLPCIHPDEEWLKLPPDLKPKPPARKRRRPEAGGRPDRKRPQGKRRRQGGRDRKKRAGTGAPR